MAQFPVEPFNTFSNLFFLAVTLYWYRTKGKCGDPVFTKFINTTLPILLVGYVGGSVYHATRSHVGWMVMDVLPIYILAVMAAYYHWKLIKIAPKNILKIICLILGLPLFVLWYFFPNNPDSISLGYGILTLPIVLPIFIDQYRLRGKFLKQFIKPLLLITVALGFRVADSSSWVQQNMPIGTHWLWHCFGALTCHYLLAYMAERSQYQD